MAKRFSVSVSDSLGERFEAFQDKLSPSTIFQKALESAVDREERFTKTLKEGTDMQTIVERLKKEKQEVVGGLYEQGRKDGLRWAKNVDYESLVHAVNFTPLDYHGSMLDFSDRNADEGSLEYTLHEFLEENQDYHCDDAGCLPEEVVRYVEGFLESVADFWKEVEPHLS